MTRSVLCYRVVELKLRGRFQLTYRQPAHDHGGSSMPGRASSHRVLPRALRPGDTVGVVAPAGPISDRARVEARGGPLERLPVRVRYDSRGLWTPRYPVRDA